MKKQAIWFGSGLVLATATYIFLASAPSNNGTMKAGVVSFKTCVENSKVGKKNKLDLLK